MSTTTNRKQLDRRFARYDASLRKAGAGSFTTFEDGTVAPWTIQWGTRQIPCHSLKDAAAFIDRYEGKNL